MKRNIIFLILIISSLLICGCEISDEHDVTKYEIPDENVFGQDLSDYENKDEFDIDKYSYDLLDSYMNELDECIKEKIDDKFIASYVKEIRDYASNEDEIYEILNDYKDMMRITIEKECSVKK